MCYDFGVDSWLMKMNQTTIQSMQRLITNDEPLSVGKTKDVQRSTDEK